jgi:IS30 family transposase
VERVKPLLKKGQSLEHIWDTHPGLFPCSARTFYRWINLGVLDVLAIDLPKKVSYRIRKKRKGTDTVRSDLTGHTYDCFSALPLEQQISCVEMDCVCGKRSDKTAILTLYFRRLGFQLMYLIARHDQEHVAKALDTIEEIIGSKEFKRFFQVILTDRGSEFLDTARLERSLDGTRRCTVYYCDPMCSGQKGGCEKNHVELRKIIPKGTSLDCLSARDISIACSHVNSYARASLGAVDPYTLAQAVLPQQLFDGFGLEHIAPEDVMLKPGLLQIGR